MRRSVLIVICDFLILSALSLSTGVGQPGTSGGGSQSPTIASSASATKIATTYASFVSNEEIELFIERTKAKQLADDFRALEIALKEKEQRVKALAQTKKSLEKNAESLTKNLSEREKKIKELADVASNLDQERTKLKNTVKAKDQTIQNLDMKTKTLLEEKTKLTATVKNKEATIVDLDKKAKALLVEKTQLTATIQQKEQKIKALDGKTQALLKEKSELHMIVQDKEKKLGDLNKKALELASQRGNLESLIKNKETQILKLQQQTQTLSNAQSNLSQTVEQKAAQLAQLDKLTKELAEEKKKLSRTLKEKDNKLWELNKNIDLLAHEQKKLKTTIKDKEERIDFLKKSSSILVEGYAALKDVIKDKDQNLEDLRKRNDEIKDSLKFVKTELTEVIDHKKEEIETLRKQLKGSGYIWEKYRHSAMELFVHIRERSPFADNYLNEKLFLPEILVNGKRFLIGEFDSIGLGWSKIPDGQVLELSYKIVKKDKDAKPHELTKPIVVYTPEPKICLIPVPKEIKGSPLNPIGFKKLSERGLEGIYLFKKDGRSREVKCSFLTDGKDYLYIHDPMLENVEMKSEQGDFLFTKEGDFVGVLVADTKAFIFPTTIFKGEIELIPILKKHDERFYRQFASRVKAVKQTIQ